MSLMIGRPIALDMFVSYEEGDHFDRGQKMRIVGVDGIWQVIDILKNSFGQTTYQVTRIDVELVPLGGNACPR